MGFLKVFGIALEWDDSKPYINKIKWQGIMQIISWIKSAGSRECEIPKFGYELEFHKVIINENEKKVRIDLSGEEDVFSYIEKQEDTPFILQPEYGKWMIEVVPRDPFKLEEVTSVQKSVSNLYKFITERVGNESILSISSFPTLGVGDFYYEKTKFVMDEDRIYNVYENPFSKSDFFQDVCINSHPRFGCLTRNIRQRRGEKVCILIPVYQDEKTNLTEKTHDEPFPGYIYMDAMGFGMGSSCFQVTVGAFDLTQCCYLYDQFIALGPILLALTASSPFFKGKLSGHDVRFDVISQSVDDRNLEEKDPKSANFINKSRFGPAYTYLSETKIVQEHHNDGPKFPINEEFLKILVSNNIPLRLATHICNLFVRDPLVIFSQKIDITDPKDFSHFENLQSTNWNAARFKPPRVEDKDSCFKVEVRACELQLTPYENASITTLILLIYKMSFKFKFNFIIPISLVDENMKRSYLCEAVTKQKFYFRTNFLMKDYMKKANINDNVDSLDESYFSKQADAQNIQEMTIDEILNGCDKFNFPGLVPVIYQYIDMYEASEAKYLKNHIEFLRLRSKGLLQTDAMYMRNFVLKHPKYNKDSLLNDEIVYDLIKHTMEIQNGNLLPEELFVKDLLN